MENDELYKQLNLILSSDYRIPILHKTKFGNIGCDAFAPKHYISLKDVIYPLLYKLETMDKKEKYLLDIVLYLLTQPFAYMDNISKQKFVNELYENYPNTKWPTFYPDLKKN